MRKVVFEGDALAVIRSLPSTAKQRAGYEIDRVQRGKEPENWKPFPSIGKGVREIRIQLGRQFRVIYFAKFGNCVHILHVFEKKSQKTRLSDIDLARERFSKVVKRYQTT